MSWTLVIILGLLWSTVISHFGASILLHRYFCHKQFSAPVWFEVIGLGMLMIAVIRTPIGWISSYRIHHAYSDTEFRQSLLRTCMPILDLYFVINIGARYGLRYGLLQY